MIRKFRLINGEGVSWDLNARTSFFHSIGGFGYKDGTQYEQIGTDFIPLEELFSQGVMTGRIFFGGRNAYVNYRAFSRFVRAVPLTLVYEMEEAFRVPVRMTEIAKSELITGGAGLDCEVAFTAAGLFYKNVSGYSGTLSIGGKIYPYEYAYAYADAELYDEIVQGYEDGAREIYVAGEDGPRKLTKEEELDALDAAYRKTVDSFVEMERTNQHAHSIIGEEAEKIAKISRRETKAAGFLKEQKARGIDKVPENLNQKMLSAAALFKEKYAAFNPNAGTFLQLLAGIKISQ